MKVGVQLPEVERLVRWSELCDMARLSEEVGLDSVWVGDHLLYREPFPEPRGPWEAWTILAALAAVTTRVEIGPLVACLLFHNPAMLAKKAATVEEVSGGRLVLGVGAGWSRTEFDAYGYPFDRRASRFEEALHVVGSLLRTGRVDFVGRFVRAPDCELVPRGPRPDGPPIVVGSVGDRMLRIAAKRADAVHAWYSWYGNSPAGIPPLRAKLDAACSDVGRDPASLPLWAALLVRFPDGRGRRMGDEASAATSPIEADALPDVLAALWDAGVAHVQIVADPITLPTIESLGALVHRARAR